MALHELTYPSSLTLKETAAKNLQILKQNKGFSTIMHSMHEFAETIKVNSFIYRNNKMKYYS